MFAKNDKTWNNIPMRRQYTPIIFGAILFLFLLSYRYSLLHDTSLLPYLNTPDTVPPFQKLLTYVFMMIGIPPTILMILFTSIFCTTSYPNYVVLYTCFGSPFVKSSQNGFIAYLIASCLSTGILGYLYSVFSKNIPARK